MSLYVTLLFLSCLRISFQLKSAKNTSVLISNALSNFLLTIPILTRHLPPLVQMFIPWLKMSSSFFVETQASALIPMRVNDETTYALRSKNENLRSLSIQVALV